MNFKLPNYNLNNEQFKTLEDIQLSQKNILTKCADLSERISELEKFQHDISLTIQQKTEHDDNSFEIGRAHV